MPDASGNATDAELIAAGQAAGLTGDALAKAAATVRAEGGSATARNYAGNTPESSVDRGFGQFNSFWHPEVTDACSADLMCSMQAIARISNGGTDFSPWAATRTSRFGPLVSHFTELIGAAPAPSSSASSGGAGAPSDATPPALGGLGSSPLSPAGGGGAPSGGGIGNPFDAVGSAISGGLAPIGNVFTNVRTGFQMAAWRVAFVGLGVLMVGAGVLLFFRAPLEEEAKSKVGAAAGGAS